MHRLCKRVVSVKGEARAATGVGLNHSSTVLFTFRGEQEMQKPRRSVFWHARAEGYRRYQNYEQIFRQAHTNITRYQAADPTPVHRRINHAPFSTCSLNPSTLHRL